MKFEGLEVDIKDVQKIQLEILLEFDRICRLHGIKYILFAGTLLGAVRHKGFIPWDDDIDVCMLREDYNNFLKICEKELSSKYFLQTYNTDKNYINQFAKLRKNGTIFVEKVVSELNIHHGIFIDIFPLDNVKPNTLLGNIHQKCMYTLQIINLLRIKRICLDTKKYSGVIFTGIKLGIHYFLKIIPKDFINKLQTRVASAFIKEETDFISHLTNLPSKDRYIKYLMSKSDFLDIIEGEFEGYKLPIPKNYNKILSNIFGDYMKLPPEDKRKPHHGIIEIKIDMNNKKLNT